MINKDTVTLVTIITESVLEKKLTKEIVELGAHGFTVFDVRGLGGAGYRSADWRESANIKIEVVCNSEVAKKIIDHVKLDYFRNFAIIIYSDDVKVLRSDKF